MTPNKQNSSNTQHAHYNWDERENRGERREQAYGNGDQTRGQGTDRSQGYQNDIDGNNDSGSFRNGNYGGGSYQQRDRDDRYSSNERFQGQRSPFGARRGDDQWQNDRNSSNSEYDSTTRRDYDSTSRGFDSTSRSYDSDARNLNDRRGNYGQQGRYGSDYNAQENYGNSQGRSYGRANDAYRGNNESWNKGEGNSHSGYSNSGQGYTGNYGSGWGNTDRSGGNYGSSNQGMGNYGGQSGNYDSGSYGSAGNADGGKYGQSSYSGLHKGKGPKGYQRSDDRIKEDLNDRLSDDDHLDASDIEVEVKDSEVILSGTVESREAKRRAEDIAERISGVSNVENRIRLNKDNAKDNSKTSTSGTESQNSGSNSNNAAGAGSSAANSTNKNKSTTTTQTS